MSMPKRPTVTKGKKNAKYELSSTLNTAIGHYKGRTIQEIVDSDSNGDNINHLLRYRAAGDGSLTERGYPFRYHDFSDEVNVTLDVYLYANPKLLELYKARYTKGELTLKLKEIDTENRQKREREIREFQEAERQKLEEYMQEARAEEERRTKYSGEWGAW